MAINPFDQFDQPANAFDQFDNQPEKAKPASAIRKLGDLGLGFASGAVGATKALADVAGADNKASRVLGDINTGINDYLSPAAKADQQEQGAIMAGAAGKGTWEGVKAGVKAFGVAPVQTAVQGLGSVVPIIAGTALTGGVAPAAAVGAGIGVAMGAGTAKGSIFEEVKKRGIAKGLTEAQATAEADKAQEYGGANTDQIALGGALGAADALTGVSAAASRMARNALGKPVTQALTNTAERGVLGRAGMGMLKEMPLEAAQGGQEQVAANVAAQRAGYEAGTFDNVASNATLEALASAGPGAAFGALDTQTKQTPPPVVPPAVPPAIDQLSGLPPTAAVAPTAPTAPGMGFNPDAGKMTQFPDGSQSFTSEVPPAAPVKPSEAMGINPTDGPISAAAALSVDAGVTQEIQINEANAADQAAYEQATQAQAQQAAEQDTADKPITTGKLAEAQLSEDDKRAILFSNKAVADGGIQYEGTQDGDILNGQGQPYSTRFAAARRARMEGKDWTIATVFDGYVARRKDAIEQNTAQGTDPEAVEAPGQAPQAVASPTTPAAELPAEGGGAVEGVGLNQPPAPAEQAQVATESVALVTPDVTPDVTPLITPERVSRANRPNELKPDSTPEEIEAQMESEYRESIREGIQARLGLTKPAPEKDEKKTPFKSFLREYGINPAHTSDIAGRNRFRANNMLPATFRANGLGLDALVERAIERGFMTEDDRGDQGKLIAMIQGEIAGDTQVSSEFADEDAAAQTERVQRMDIESMADELGLPYSSDTSTDRLASMVNRINTRLKDEPRGTTKAQRILANAKETVARIERKRAKYDAELAGFAEADIAVQDVVLDAQLDEDGNPVIVRMDDIRSTEAWLEENQQWDNGYGTDTSTNSTARQDGAPVTGPAQAGPGPSETQRSEAQPGSPEAQAGQPEGLTAPTRADVLAQQERTDNAQALDDRAQIDAEASRQTLTRQNAPEQRRDTSVDMFGEEKAALESAKKDADAAAKNEAAKDPNQGSMFDEPTEAEAQTDATASPQPETGTDYAKDFAIRPVEIIESLMDSGAIKALYKAAGVKTANAFGDLPMESQSNAYAKFVSDGGTPAPAATESYNDKVTRMEREIVVRRLQSDQNVNQANGKPFKTEASAKQFSSEFDLEDTHKVAQSGTGYTLQRLGEGQRPSVLKAIAERQANDPEEIRQNAAWAKAEVIGASADAAVAAYGNGETSIDEFESALSSLTSSRAPKPEAAPQAEPAPTWHTKLPETGVAFKLGDEKLDGSRMVIGRMAQEAADAITQVQGMNGAKMYAYVMPSTATEHGALRLLPEDQTPPAPWVSASGEGLRTGFMTGEQLTSKLREILQSQPILTSGDEKAMAAALTNPPKAKKAKPATPTVEESAAEATKPYDAARAQELTNSIQEGESILQSKRSISGKKLSKAELDMVQRSVDSSKEKLSALGEAPRFSRSAAEKPIRNLVTLHNMSSENLLYSAGVGGIPVPSIGITKVDSPFGGFGDITLIAPKGMIDPANGVPVYDRDAYTARHPEMNFKKVSAKKADAFYDRVAKVRELGFDGGWVSQIWEAIKNASTQNPDKVWKLFQGYDAPRLLYATDVLGKTVKVPMRNVPVDFPWVTDKAFSKTLNDLKAALMDYGSSEVEASPEMLALSNAARAAIERMVDKKSPEADPVLRNDLIEALAVSWGNSGAWATQPDTPMNWKMLDKLLTSARDTGKTEVDRGELSKRLDKLVSRDSEAYADWAMGLIKPLFDAPTITLRGREVEPNLQNIVDAMTIGATAGAEKTMTAGAGKTAAMLGKRFKSMAEIEAARDQVVPESVETEGKKATDKLLEDYRNRALTFYGEKDWRGQIDTWGGMDAAMNALAAAGKMGKGDGAIRMALARKGFLKVDQTTVDLAREAIDSIRNTATNYFEAKPQRAVKLNEFKGAVVPKGTSQEVLDVLAANGIEVVTYKKNDPESKNKALEKLARKIDKVRGDVLFTRGAATKSAYENRIDALFAGGKANLSGVHLLDKSDVLDLLGLGNMPVRLDESKVVLNQTNHPEMTAEIWKKIPEWMDNPALVTKSSTVDGRYVITPSETVQGYPIRIILEPKGGSVRVHALVNAYAPMGANGALMEIKRIEGQISRGAVSYVDTKKASELLGRSGLQLPRVPSLNTDRRKILTEKNLAGYRKQNPSALSRGSNTTGLPTPQVTSIVDAIKARWGNAPEIVVADNMADPMIPQAVRDYDQTQKSQGATGEPEGFVYQGKVYIVASELATPTDVMRVLFHESLGHLGLRGVFGDKLNPILDQITAMRRADVIKKARQYGLVRVDRNGNPTVDVKTATDAEVLAAMTQGNKREAAEEILAEMAQEKPELGYVQRAIGLIRGWLRANVPGFSSMKLTDADIVAQFILPARRYIDGKGGPKGGMPKGSKPMFSFSGKNSSTADAAQLATAQARLTNGDNAETVRKETGWFKGADGKMRFEINDSDAKLTMDQLSWGDAEDLKRGDTAGLLLGRLLDHPALFAAYPVLEDGVWVRLIPRMQGASFDPTSNTIEVGYDKTTNQANLSSLLHEIQHAIQTIEDFASGGSPRSMMPENSKEILAERQAILDEIGTLQSGDSRADALWANLDAIENPTTTAQKRYERLAGEVEARNTQARQGMTPDQRRDQSPESTADVKAEDVIVVFNGKEMLSAPMPANAINVVAGNITTRAAFGRGKNGAVTNPNDVVGNQGGRSADDYQPGVSEFQQRLIAAQDMADEVKSTGQRLTIRSDGTVSLFHSTSESNANAIRAGGTFKGNTWFSASKAATIEHAKPKHGKSTTTIEVAVDPRHIEFSTGTGEFYAPDGLTRNDAGIWVKPNESTAPDSGGATRFSRTVGRNSISQAVQSTQDALKNATVTDLLKQFGNRLSDFRGLGLQTLGRRQLVDIYSKDLPAMVPYSDMVAQMEADKNESGAEADRLATDWGKLKDERQLAELMHDATLAQIDPDKPAPPAPTTKGRESFNALHEASEHRKLKEQFDKLSDEAKAAYRTARDMYSTHNDKVRDAIQERIMRSELSSAKKQALLERMDGEFFKKVKGVYFPLARFGSYVTVVKDSAGNVVSANRSETMNEAEATRKVLQTQFPASGGFKVGKVLRDREFNAARDGVGRGFMADLFQTLEKTGAGEELMDSISQLYLAALPDLSWAKHGIHRKGTPGFSQDARRAFAQNMFHGARYLAKLRYADQLQTGLDAMQDHIAKQADNEAYDSVKAQQVVDEMVKRHESLMNPASNPLSTALTSIGFVFHLGLSPASALVNLSQTALVALPVMGAKWGFTKSSAALLLASKQAAGNKNDISTALKGDERTAYDEAVRRGVIDVTMAHDLAGIAQGEDSKVSAAFKPVMKYASFLFHHAEKFNRQVTFVASYRLARAAGTAHEAAFDESVKATYDGHFDYGAANRPRLMQGNVARVVFLFKQYSQNMIYTLTRSAQQAIKAETAENRAEARKVFSGLLVSHAMAAGVFGLPVVGMLMSAASAIGGDDDEPWDAKVALKNMLADSLGPKSAEVFAHGLSRLTPWDISGRVGLDRLLLPDVQEGLEGTRAAESWATQALGPVIGIGVNMVKGLSEMGKGEYQRGLESMLPSALRGPMKAYRYETEGNIDKSGVTMNDNVSLAGVAGQALGFSPSETRLAQEGKSAIYSADRAIQSRRTNLVRQFALASMASDSDGTMDARKDIARFNEKNPNARITQSQLVASIRARKRRIEQAKQGVYLPSKRQDAMEAGRFAVTE